jgi:hypothetical protein
VVTDGNSHLASQLIYSPLYIEGRRKLRKRLPLLPLAKHRRPIEITGEIAERTKLDEWNMKIVTRLTEWPSAMRRVSINSFGYGGANAHVVGYFPLC